MFPAGTVVIADRSTAGKILCSPRRRAGIGYLVSIGGAQDREPAGFRYVPERLRLVFEDAVTLVDGGQSQSDIERLIRFARRVDLAKGRVLVHCQSGISRLSATAAILLSVVGGPGQEGAALRYVLSSHPVARPINNVRMRELGDEALGTGGALARALRSGVGSSRPRR